MLSMMLLGLAAAGSGWADYKPASLAKAWSEAVIVEGATVTIETANLKFLVEGTYTGEHRELDVARRDLFKAWVRAVGHPPEHADLCTHEIQVRSAKQTYWLPIQNSLLDPFAHEAKQETRLRLHIMYIGAAGKERVFMVNRFEALEP